MDTVTIIITAISVCASIVAVLAYLNEHKKQTRNDGATSATMQADVRYMREGFDDLRLDVKELIRKQDAMSERQTAEEIKRTNLEKRVDKIEERVDRLEQTK